MIWARLEIKQAFDVSHSSYRCNIVVEGCASLRKVFRKKLILGSTSLCEVKNDIHVRQQRLHASLSASCGTLHYPLYRVMELFEAEGYVWKCSPSSYDREVHLFKKTISEE